MLSKLIIGTVQFGLNYGITNTNGKTSKEDLDNIFNFCKSFLVFRLSIFIS